MTIEELVARCKASVTLTVNGHRDVYATVEEYIGDDAILDVPPETMGRFKAGGDMYELHFYPNTPVGFYRVWGSTLDEVMTQAEECLQARNPK